MTSEEDLAVRKDLLQIASVLDERSDFTWSWMCERTNELPNPVWHVLMRGIEHERNEAIRFRAMAAE